jgi:hypothetical protein
MVEIMLPKERRWNGLFRDIHSFNLAMLAKQVWRLIKDPESLCARVLRAKIWTKIFYKLALKRDAHSYDRVFSQD